MATQVPFEALISKQNELDWHWALTVFPQIQFERFWSVHDIKHIPDESDVFMQNVVLEQNVITVVPHAQEFWN